MLDVGMGTGIISIIARKEGVPKVKGVDPKTEAIKRAKENMEYNKITEVEYEKDIKGVKEKYPLIIANITSSILEKIKKDLLERIEDGGALYVTGILDAPYYMKKMINGWLDNEQKKEYQIKYIKNEEKNNRYCAWEITKIK
jgi:ribosomal protein L11 methylase PrmA